SPVPVGEACSDSPLPVGEADAQRRVRAAPDAYRSTLRGDRVLRIGTQESAQVVAKLLGPARMAELSQSLSLDLTNAFAGYPELAPDLFECSLTPVVEAKTQGNDAALAL